MQLSNQTLALLSASERTKTECDARAPERMPDHHFSGRWHDELPVLEDVSTASLACTPSRSSYPASGCSGHGSSWENRLDINPSYKIRAAL